MAKRVSPTKNCSGVRASRSSGSSVKASNGLELRQASTSVRNVDSSSEVSGLADGASQVMLDSLDSCFPQAAEVWSCRWIEAPPYSSVCKVPDNSVDLTASSLEEVPELSVRAYKVSAAVAVNDCALVETRTDERPLEMPRRCSR
ncbi:uncharacterized protein LOC114939981 [Nylanderia fulva]|nr:uncharacterized protein LOC114939981 [Nylanderia fulva]